MGLVASNEYNLYKDIGNVQGHLFQGVAYWLLDVSSLGCALGLRYWDVAWHGRE